jgi:hypothetical protein
MDLPGSQASAGKDFRDGAVSSDFGCSSFRCFAIWVLALPLLFSFVTLN